jgi:hypothetical protein
LEEWPMSPEKSEPKDDTFDDLTAEARRQGWNGE